MSTKGIRLPIISQIVNVLDLQFQGQTFEMSLFCNCFKMTEFINLIFGKHLYVSKGHYGIKLLSNGNVLDLHFHVQMFCILLICCNSKAVEPSTINVGKSIDRCSKVPVRSPMFLTHFKCERSPLCCFVVFKLTIETAWHEIFGFLYHRPFL